MTRLVATSQSGTRYHFDSEGGSVKVENANEGASWQSGVSIRRTLGSLIAPDSPELRHPNYYRSGEKTPWVQSLVPEVGSRWYIADGDQWRICTPIVSIEEED